MFNIQEHVIPCQFVREYPRATADGQNTALSLAVKQYTPSTTADPSFQRITLIGAHGNGFPKELYEPLWEELHDRLLEQQIAIQHIWIADAAHQGASGLLNEEKLGNDPSLFDHARDLIHMINHFQSQMTLPLIGVGHSMGATQLIHAALTHARLFHAQVLIEPVLYDRPPHPAARGPAHAAATRRDIWPSRDALADSVAKSRLYASWDARCLQRWLRYGVRPAPTTSDGGPDASDAVTLVTTKDQETFALTRPTYLGAASGVGNGLWTPPAPDATAALDNALRGHAHYALLQPEPMAIFHQLPLFRPAALYVYGARSEFLRGGGLRARAMERTGAGVLGSGGMARGRVQTREIEDAGHMAPVEQPGRIARQTAGWIAEEMRRWREELAVVEREWRGKTGAARRRLDGEFLSRLGVKL